MPTHSQVELTAIDGRVLQACRFDPPEPARATVVILGAYAVPARYYRRFASWLAGHGFCVLTFDPRGIGASRVGAVRDEPIDATGWATRDYAAALDWLAAQPGPRLAVAHSFGGQVLGVTDAAKSAQGVYAIGAQLGYWGYFDGLTRYRMRALFSVAMPLLTRTFGYLPGWTGIGEDVPPNALLEWARWLRSPGYLLDHVPGAAERFRRWPGRYVGLGFTDDGYAPPRGVQALAACLDPSRTVTRIVEPSDFGLRAVNHFGFFREHAGDVLWRDALDQLVAWVEEDGARLGQRGSGVAGFGDRPLEGVAG